MSDEKAKRFQAMILAEYNRGREAFPDLFPPTVVYKMLKTESDAIGGVLDKNDLETACFGMMRLGALALRFLADADKLLDGLPKKT